MLSPSIVPLVAELSRGVVLGVFCPDLLCKAWAARALGHMGQWAGGDALDAMAKSGAVQALLRLLRLPNLWHGLDSRWARELYQMKGDVGVCVRAIAAGGDLARGRLLEAGALPSLERIWAAQVHNADGKEAVRMREECHKAFLAVKGPQRCLMDQPPSSYVTPSQSRNASPTGSPRRRRPTAPANPPVSVLSAPAAGRGLSKGGVGDAGSPGARRAIEGALL